MKQQNAQRATRMHHPPSCANDPGQVLWHQTLVDLVTLKCVGPFLVCCDLFGGATCIGAFLVWGF